MHCALCSVHCRVFSVHFFFFTLQYRVCSVQYAVCSVEYSVCKFSSWLCRVECSVSSFKVTLQGYFPFLHHPSHFGSHYQRPTKPYTVLHCPALHCTALYCTALHYIALICTVLHCTALYIKVWASTRKCIFKVKFHWNLKFVLFFSGLKQPGKKN